MSQPIIEFRNFKKAYRAGFLGRPAVAVKNLDLSVPAGCIYGFLGANGAGKTTSIKVLMGLQFADAGEVKVFGTPIFS
jgi:ABC-2 type transport system ATP-binding protein